MRPTPRQPRVEPQVPRVHLPRLPGLPRAEGKRVHLLQRRMPTRAAGVPLRGRHARRLARAADSPLREVCAVR
eukprot:11096572-Heterocapsa_arctica.AAC.1